MIAFRLRSAAARRRRSSGAALRLESGVRRLVAACVAIGGAIDLAVMIVRDGSPLQWGVPDWGAAIVLLTAAGIVAARA